MTKILSQSKKWKRDADTILAKSKLLNILKKFGKVEFSGSFSADLMMSGDIDIYVVNKVFTRKKVLEIFNQIATFCLFEGYFFYDWKKNKHPDFPSAYYIGLKTKVRKVRWKVDIWFLTKDDIKKIAYYNLKNIKISKKQKVAILRFKQFRDNFFQNVPSIAIYDAVIKENLFTLEEFKEFLKNKF